jgi:DNA (cytosine-5)-methyltransferase 1
MDQTSIFDLMYEKFKIDKPIRLIEFFSGYGSQALALKYLGVPFESWKTCEWAIKSIQAYKDIHFTEDKKDYSKDLTKEKLQEYLFNKGISSNYNEPMTKQQIDRLSEDNLRTIYNNIKATHNLVNIQQVKGSDLEIKDIDKFDYILTYSFPCQ